MGKFIRLTRLHGEKTFDIFVNTDHVHWFENYHSGGKRTCTHVALKWHTDDFISVKENPEEIYALIKQEKKPEKVEGNLGKAMRGEP